MTPLLVFSVIAGYFGILLIIGFLTTKNINSETFFTANRQSPWYLVAFGMIGASLSGVTFISVPGWVASSQFSYLQMVLGYLVGYTFIAAVLLPLYYRLNLTSIYEYLIERFGFWSHKTGASFFLLSRTAGASARLFLMAMVLQLFFFDAFSIPFEVTVAVTLALIWIYTFKGGIKTIVWTDTLQTFFMLAAAILTLIAITHQLNWTLSELPDKIAQHSYSKTFFFEDSNHKNFFWKKFWSGAFIALVMTGLDQDMMQKNLTCRSLFDAQKNVFWFSISLVFVNLIFLSLGVLLFIYAQENGIQIPEKTDHLYPLLAQNHFDIEIGILFLLGIIAAAYSSADSALTSLTTSFCTDILDFKNSSLSEIQKRNLRIRVHLSFTVILFFVILAFRYFMETNAISAVFKIAGFTYGPLLGLYAFGLFTKFQVKDKFVPLICILSPILSYLLDANSKEWFNGFEFGFTILMVNGLLTFIGLLIIRKKSHNFLR